MRHLKLGPDVPYWTGKKCYIALDAPQLSRQLSGDLLVSRECSSLAELEAEVTQIRAELGQILKEARGIFGS